MSQGSEQAPAGWYPDPHDRERLRYFDGEMWTNHFHQPGRLPDIGRWFGTTFAVFGQYWRAAAVLAVGTTLVGSALIWIAIRVLVDDLAVIDEVLVAVAADGFVDVPAGTIAGFVLVVLFALLWQGFGWMAMSRFMHRAHFHADPTVADAVLFGIRRVPHYLLVFLALVFAGTCITLIVVFLVAAVPLLGLLALLGFFVGLIWAAVKLAFVFTAIVAAPRGDSVIRASAEVSDGRFWGVFGRLLLVTIGLAIAGQVIALGLGDYGQMVDADLLSEVIRVDGDVVTVLDFRLVDLLPSAGQFVAVLVVNSIVQGATSIITMSALMRLYLDAGAPAIDLDTTPAPA